MSTKQNYTTRVPPYYVHCVCARVSMYVYMSVGPCFALYIFHTWLCTIAKHPLLFPPPPPPPSRTFDFQFYSNLVFPPNLETSKSTIVYRLFSYWYHLFIDRRFHGFSLSFESLLTTISSSSRALTRTELLLSFTAINARILTTIQIFTWNPNFNASVNRTLTPRTNFLIVYRSVNNVQWLSNERVQHFKFRKKSERIEIRPSTGSLNWRKSEINVKTLPVEKKRNLTKYTCVYVYIYVCTCLQTVVKSYP